MSTDWKIMNNFVEFLKRLQKHCDCCYHCGIFILAKTDEVFWVFPTAHCSLDFVRNPKLQTLLHLHPVPPLFPAMYKRMFLKRFDIYCGS